MSSPKDTPPPDGDADRGPVLLAVTIVTTMVALIVVALRMFVRVKIVKNVGWDDHTINAASFLAILVMIFEIISVSYGNGRHMYYLPDASIPQASKWSRATTPPNLAACALARISLCIFFLRIVERRRGYTIFFWTLIVLNILVNTMSIVRLLASCRPLERLWNHSVPGECWPTSTAFITSMIQSVVSIATDWLIALFPIVIVRKLNMARRTKVVLVVLMGMGIFAGAAALLKLFHLRSLTTRSDITWDVVDLTCWSIVEQNVGIIAVSIPCIRPLFSRIFRIGSTPSDPNGNKPYRSDYHLGPMNVSGRQKAPFTAGTAISMAGKEMGTGSESSLVRAGNEGNEGIMRTVSVSLRSQRLEGKEGDLEEGKRSWFRG
ncbi:hypothetical protein QBC34DRAFT_214792 [Podospora aff. communis PSN243]|uniref:Rhodopsin domain-containing protein n=1 Tax=Podospora aff. communis PSN243 TaxID=3040156 RepID=A0AAV9G6N4_9PEZI|nr:hypothetical protein QBC34DRAFT_214792 [Podospora aff. communis PSN243]